MALLACEHSLASVFLGADGEHWWLGVLLGGLASRTAQILRRGEPPRSTKTNRRNGTHGHALFSFARFTVVFVVLIAHDVVFPLRMYDVSFSIVRYVHRRISGWNGFF